jgi:hypothetical protein
MTLLGTKADFSQRDPRWKGIFLGFSDEQTMGPYGCFVASMASVAQAQGKDIDPKQMNQVLKDKGQFVVDSVGEKSDVAGPGALSKIYPDIENIENKNWGRSALTPEDFKFFDIRRSATDDIIVMLDYHPTKAGIQNHYCRVIGINDKADDIEIVDTYTGKRIWVSSLGRAAKYLIYRAYKYRGLGAGFSNARPAPRPTMVAIKLKGDKKQHWNMRTSAQLGGNVRTDGYGLGGQTYTAEIVSGGWARILFRSSTAYLSPNAFVKI